MALQISTFSNVRGGSSLFKALGHPLAVPRAQALLERLAGAGPVALYDPAGQAATFAALYDLSCLPLAGVFVQDAGRIGEPLLGHAARPVTELPACEAAAVLLACFDAGRALAQIRHLIPARAEVLTLDELRLPAEMLGNPRRYLDPLNFATNFAFFRDAQGHHTRLVTANYWAGYGARGSALWLCLLDADGRELAAWEEPLPEGVATVVVDSGEVRERFGLGEFTGSLFVHALRVTGHDVVKYALDTFGDEETALSCTHDANAWPADYYAGLPAPDAGQRVLLWVQNSHPRPIPTGGVGLAPMGSDTVRWHEREIPGFGTAAIDVAELVPEAAWPQQLELHAGKHFVRPRYEVIARGGRRRIAHANVERSDLEPDPALPGLPAEFGKGFLLPAPVLPAERWRSLILPTPMTRRQRELPVQLLVYDAGGEERLRHRLGRLARRDSVAVDVSALLEEAGETLQGGYGHMELVYDFNDGGEGDGWLHALFRYEDRHSGHGADSSFGSHVFNTVLTWGSEPQSYAGPPPGLSTRLYLRLGADPAETFCHLIYPASSPWHPRSETDLVLLDRHGEEVARRRVEIPCSGSLLWHYSETFDAQERRQAGEGAWVQVRDTSCRLFGYHGLLHGEAAFSLDHMFGF